MVRSLCTILLVVSAAETAAQSLSDLARQAEQQRKGQPVTKSYTAKDLPGPARIDSALGNFVLTEDLVGNYRRAEVRLARARNSADLDTWLMKWQHDTRNDPFGMIAPYGQDKRLAGVFDDITPQDYVFVEVAIDRARNDLVVSKGQRVMLPAPRRANVEFIEKYEGNLGPSWELDQELRFLEARRAGRQRK
jgi:hypothetical protein